MKYKTLLLLIFTLILNQTIHAQGLQIVVTGNGSVSSGGASVANVEQWSVDDMRVTIFPSLFASIGAFVEGSPASLTISGYGPTLYAGINWHGDNPQPDEGVHSWTGSLNASLGISLENGVSVSIDAGVDMEFTLKLADREGGCAELYLEIKVNGGAGAKTGVTYDKFLGRFYKDYPDKVFDKNDNLIDRKTKDKILDKNGKPITKKQLDAEKAAAAAAKAASDAADEAADMGGLPPIPSFPPPPPLPPKPPKPVKTPKNQKETITIGEATVIEYITKTNGE